LIEIGSKTAEKNSAQTNRQTDTTKIMVTWPWANNEWAAETSIDRIVRYDWKAYPWQGKIDDVVILIAILLWSWELFSSFPCCSCTFAPVHFKDLFDWITSHEMGRLVV